MTGVLANQTMNFFTSVNTPKRLGNAHPNIVPYQTFAMSDGDIIVVCGNAHQFRALCDVVNLRHLGTDPKFATNPELASNRAGLIALLGTTIEGRSKNNFMQALEKAVVPAGPINTVKQAWEDPQIVHRGLQINPEGVAGLRTPISFSRSKLSSTHAAPKRPFGL
jgi:crotonobetainyl-CoA:carnitine CoA-transferase CaiB-like acyl-CoA transferase